MFVPQGRRVRLPVYYTPNLVAVNPPSIQMGWKMPILWLNLGHFLFCRAYQTIPFASNLTYLSWVSLSILSEAALEGAQDGLTPVVDLELGNNV